MQYAAARTATDASDSGDEYGTSSGTRKVRGTLVGTLQVSESSLLPCREIKFGNCNQTRIDQHRCSIQYLLTLARALFSLSTSARLCSHLAPPVRAFGLALPLPPRLGARRADDEPRELRAPPFELLDEVLDPRGALGAGVGVRVDGGEGALRLVRASMIFSNAFCAFMKAIAASSASADPGGAVTLSGWFASATLWKAFLTSAVDARMLRPRALCASASERPTRCQRVPERSQSKHLLSDEGSTHKRSNWRRRAASRRCLMHLCSVSVRSM